MNEYDISKIIAIPIVVMAGAILYIKQNRSKNTEISINSKKELINKKLTELELSFTNKAIGYYLNSLLFESTLSKKEQTELSDKYPTVLSLPRLEWGNFTIINEEGNILNELIKERIEEYDKKDKYTIEDSFRYLLLEKAKKEAEQIINEKENNVQSTK